jgi:hypothetical protein
MALRDTIRKMKDLLTELERDLDRFNNALYGTEVPKEPEPPKPEAPKTEPEKPKIPDLGLNTESLTANILKTLVDLLSDKQKTESETTTPKTTKPEPPDTNVITKVFATCWGNKEDEEAGYWEHMAYNWSPKCTPGSGMKDMGVALPGRVSKGTTVDLKLTNNNVWLKGVPVIDVGPWNTKDFYWRSGSRPQAETGTDLTGRRTNKAGIDLTPAVWAKLLGKSPEAMWSSSPSAYVDIVVHEDSKDPKTLGPDDLSPHFTISKDCCHLERHPDNILPDSLRPNAVAMAQVLEKIRAEIGRPLPTNSWYRSPEVNAAQSGASKTSKHMQALAVDLERSEEIWRAIRAIDQKGLLLQVEGPPDHYHVALTIGSNEPLQVKFLTDGRKPWEG